MWHVDYRTRLWISTDSGVSNTSGKAPKAANLDPFPLERARVIAPNMSSRISLPSFKVDSQFRAISLASSALVNFPDISSMDAPVHADDFKRAVQRAAVAARAGSGSGSPATAG